MLWLMALVGAFFGGRAIGIQEERKRLPEELVAEKAELLRRQEHAEHLESELNKRIAEWIKEANDLTAARNAPQPDRPRRLHDETE
ncbi:MAG TPA: hypothetical protein VHC22_14245 [Pirellulales bacterium]|nr:hypothetical protein [Pirellulales bacterium]